MKGLLKNNLYATFLSGKLFAIFMLLSGIFVVSVISQSLLIGYGLMGIIGFSVCALIVVKNEFTSKWVKYKLTLPVRRAEIIESQFWNQLIWIFVGLVFASAEIGISWLLHGCQFDQPFDILTLFAIGISISLFMSAIYFPFFYLCGEERGEVVLIIALVCASCIDYVIISILNQLLTPGIAAIIIGDAVLLACALMTFLFSYPLTICIYKKNEY